MFIPAAQSFMASAVLGSQGLGLCHLSNIMPAAPFQYGEEGQRTLLASTIKAPGPQAEKHIPSQVPDSWFMNPSFGFRASRGQHWGSQAQLVDKHLAVHSGDRRGSLQLLAREWNISCTLCHCSWVRRDATASSLGTRDPSDQVGELTPGLRQSQNKQEPQALKSLTVAFIVLYRAMLHMLGASN